MRESIRAVFGAFRALGFVRILLAPERPSAMFPLSAGIRWTLGFEGLQGARLEGRVWRCSVALSDRARGGAGVVPAARTRHLRPPPLDSLGLTLPRDLRANRSRRPPRTAVADHPLKRRFAAGDGCGLRAGREAASAQA